jgi:hypothetical protein
MKAKWFCILLVLASTGMIGCDLLSPSKVSIHLNNTGSHGGCYVDVEEHKHLDLGDFSPYVAAGEDLGTVPPHATGQVVEVDYGYTVTFYCQRCGPIDAAYDIFEHTTINIP